MYNYNIISNSHQRFVTSGRLIIVYAYNYCNHAIVSRESSVPSRVCVVVIVQSACMCMQSDFFTIKVVFSRSSR